MTFVGHTRELGRLRAALDRSEASLIEVSGMRGVGKSTLIRRACADFPSLLYRCSPSPDRAQRTSLGVALHRATRAVMGAEGPREDNPPSEMSWTDLLLRGAALAAPDGRGFVLVLDDAYRLTHGRSRLDDALRVVLNQARSEGRAFHVVLAGHDRTHFGEASSGKTDRLDSLRGAALHVKPLSFRAAVALLPGSTPRDLLRSYAVFGGVPRVLRTLDPSVTLSTNIRNLVLEPEAALAEAGMAWVERDVRNPTRYSAVLTALSHGEADWAKVHAGISDLTASGQVAPYLQRLEELGLVRARRSLGAAARSRSRRYRLSDPFLAFWFRFGLPRLYDSEADVTTHFNERVRPALDHQSASFLPEICRQYMENDAIEQWSSNARESGSLWGVDHDIPVAGILTSGVAYYGSCHWPAIPDSSDPLSDLDSAIRETRYGFGREARLRILFAVRELPRSIERDVARRLDASIIGAAALAGAHD